MYIYIYIYFMYIHMYIAIRNADISHISSAHAMYPHCVCTQQYIYIYIYICNKDREYVAYPRTSMYPYAMRTFHIHAHPSTHTEWVHCVSTQCILVTFRIHAVYKKDLGYIAYPPSVFSISFPRAFWTKKKIAVESWIHCLCLWMQGKKEEGVCMQWIHMVYHWKRHERGVSEVLHVSIIERGMKGYTWCIHGMDTSHIHCV